MKKLRLGVLGSTKGTDLQAIIDSIGAGKLEAEIAVVASDRADAFILERAKKHGIKAVAVERKKFFSSEEFNKKIDSILKENDVELVLLIGFMRIVREPVLSTFRNRIINIHPSLLPKYAGGRDLNVHEEVLKNKEKETGCTLHFVTEQVDEGPIIMQKKVKVLKSDTPDSLKERVQKAEQEILLEAIKLFAQHKISIVGGRVKIRG